MSETDWPSGEENIDESGRNPTQQRIDEEGENDKPAVEQENEPSPHQGEEGTEPI
jgi:hypothetical protein